MGIYIPSRIINSVVSKSIPCRMRFFDDNPVLHGTYFPGINIPIESRLDLIRDPADVILIMSRFFGEELKRKLSSELPNATIITWNQIFTER